MARVTDSPSQIEQTGRMEPTHQLLLWSAILSIGAIVLFWITYFYARRKVARSFGFVIYDSLMHGGFFALAIHGLQQDFDPFSTPFIYGPAGLIGLAAIASLLLPSQALSRLYYLPELPKLFVSIWNVIFVAGSVAVGYLAAVGIFYLDAQSLQNGIVLWLGLSVVFFFVIALYGQLAV